MLDKAQQISLKEGVRAEFLLGDITKLKLPAKVDFAVAVNDCINYVPKEKLKTAFGHVHACLKTGGAFIFDISSPNKLKTVLGNNLFAEVSLSVYRKTYFLQSGADIVFFVDILNVPLVKAGKRSVRVF